MEGRPRGNGGDRQLGGMHRGRVEDLLSGRSTGKRAEQHSERSEHGENCEPRRARAHGAGSLPTGLLRHRFSGLSQNEETYGTPVAPCDSRVPIRWVFGTVLT